MTRASRGHVAAGAPGEQARREPGPRDAAQHERRARGPLAEGAEQSARQRGDLRTQRTVRIGRGTVQPTHSVVLWLFQRTPHMAKAPPTCFTHSQNSTESAGSSGRAEVRGARRRERAHLCVSLYIFVSFVSVCIFVYPNPDLESSPVGWALAPTAGARSSPERVASMRARPEPSQRTAEPNRAFQGVGNKCPKKKTLSRACVLVKEIVEHTSTRENRAKKARKHATQTRSGVTSLTTYGQGSFQKQSFNGLFDGRGRSRGSSLSVDTAFRRGLPLSLSLSL